MEDFSSLWSFQEDMNEMRQKLLCTTMAFETLKVEASQEIRKHKEEVKQLMELLKIAYKERDEAKDQFQKLLNKLTMLELQLVLPQTHDQSPLVMPMKANSSITESNSLSETYNHHSYGSSPVDSILDAVSSPDFQSINMADSGYVNFASKANVQGYNNGSLSTGLVNTPVVPKINTADAAIESLIKGKALPQKGKLLQAVTEVGPLLQTLLVSGPLPRWRNPPPLQTFRIPPVSIKGCENANTQKSTVDAKNTAKRPIDVACYPDTSRGSSQMCSASVLNFTNGASGSGLGSWGMSSGGIDQIPAGKRQRFN